MARHRELSCDSDSRHYRDLCGLPSDRCTSLRQVVFGQQVVRACCDDSASSVERVERSVRGKFLRVDRKLYCFAHHIDRYWCDDVGEMADKRRYPGNVLARGDIGLSSDCIRSSNALVQDFH